jgi:hypothetical protein
MGCIDIVKKHYPEEYKVIEKYCTEEYNELNPALEELAMEYLFKFIDPENGNEKLRAYKRLFKYIPDFKKVEYFLQCYAFSNYYEPGLVSKAMLKKLIRVRPQSILDEINKITDERGYIKVYRGIHMLSSSTNEAISWTLSRKVAVFFASRFKDTDLGNGSVYQGIVHSKNVLACTNERKEREIVVIPGSIEDLIITQLKK